MHKRHFPPDDKLQQLVRDAYNAMHVLNVEVHYLSCDSGVGRPRRDSKQANGLTLDKCAGF